MENKFKGKSPAYHGINNARFCPMKDDGQPDTKIIDLEYSKSIALSARLERQDVYADNTAVMAIPSDQGYEGSYGTTDQDIDFEEAIGLVRAFENGLAVTKQTSYRQGFLYYEFTRHLQTNKQAYVVKVWLYGVEIGKPDVNNETDTNTLTIGTYSYPLRVNGMPLADKDGKPLTDEYGNPVHVMLMRSFPNMAGYDTFGNAVAMPKPMGTTEETPEV